MAIALFVLIQVPGASAVVSEAVVGKGVSTALDIRSLDEVKNDTKVDAALTAKLAAQPGDDFKSISALVFASRVVLVGFAPSPVVRQRAEAIARVETGYERFKDLIVVGPAPGGTAGDLALDAKINAALTTTPGVNSVNLRWKVFGGDVFLMGLAQSRHEADLAMKTVRSLDGVQRIHSAVDVGKT